ncbi:MAG: hypothetical protein ACC661_02305 [Verrucomicrobiales bacterium]
MHKSVIPRISLALLAIFVSAGGCSLAAQEPAAREQKIVLIEPKLMAPAVSREIPGARSTVLVAARETDYGGLEYYDKEAFEALGKSWEAFYREARERADALLLTLEPEFKRDSRGVIEYALLSSESQRTAGVVLAAKFLERFRESLGDELVVMIPNRSTVLVFPKLASDYADYGEAVIEMYRDAVYPASLEIFVVDARGMRAIGEFQRE